MASPRRTLAKTSKLLKRICESAELLSKTKARRPLASEENRWASCAKQDVDTLPNQQMKEIWLFYKI